MSIRITSGEFRGFRLHVPEELTTVIRPTQDRVRQAVFSSLGSRVNIEGASVLDLFSGSGIMTFEALSRGAKSSIMVDTSKKALSCSLESAKKLKIEDKISQYCLSCLALPPELGVTFDLIFADPPYREISLGCIITDLATKSMLSSSSLLIYEEDSKFFTSQYEMAKDTIDSIFSSLTVKKYGSTSVAIFKV